MKLQHEERTMKLQHIEYGGIVHIEYEASAYPPGHDLLCGGTAIHPSHARDPHGRWVSVPEPHLTDEPVTCCCCTRILRVVRDRGAELVHLFGREAM